MPDFETSVKHFGGTPHLFSQTDFLEKKSIKTGGACYPLTLKWIVDQKKGIAFSREIQTENAIKEIKSLLLEQQRDALGFARKFLEQSGLKFSEEFVKKDEISMGEMTQFLFRAPGFCTLVLSSKGALGVSSVGVHVLGFNLVKMRFFDANSGMAEFPTDYDGKNAFRRFFLFRFRDFYLDLHGQAYAARYT